MICCRQVFRAKLENSDEFYALKRIKMDNEREGVRYKANCVVSNYSNERNLAFKEVGARKYCKPKRNCHI